MFFFIFPNHMITGMNFHLNQLFCCELPGHRFLAAIFHPLESGTLDVRPRAQNGWVKTPSKPHS